MYSEPEFAKEDDLSLGRDHMDSQFVHLYESKHFPNEETYGDSSSKKNSPTSEQIPQSSCNISETIITSRDTMNSANEINLQIKSEQPTGFD